VLYAVTDSMQCLGLSLSYALADIGLLAECWQTTLCPQCTYRHPEWIELK